MRRFPSDPFVLRPLRPSARPNLASSLPTIRTLLAIPDSPPPHSCPIAPSPLDPCPPPLPPQVLPRPPSRQVLRSAWRRLDDARRAAGPPAPCSVTPGAEVAAVAPRQTLVDAADAGRRTPPPTPSGPAAEPARPPRSRSGTTPRLLVARGRIPSPAPSPRPTESNQSCPRACRAWTTIVGSLDTQYKGRRKDGCQVAARQGRKLSSGPHFARRPCPAPCLPQQIHAPVPMEASQGSARPVESAQSVEAPMELRIYLLRFDGEGSAVELARLRPCGHQVGAPLGAPAPVVVSEEAEMGRWEAAVYLAVLQGDEVKQVARLSSFLDGFSGPLEEEEGEGEEEEVGEEEESSQEESSQGGEVKQVARLSSFLQGLSWALEDEEEEEESSSQEQESQEEEEETEESSQEEEEDEETDGSSQEEVVGSVKIRMCVGLSRLVLVLFVGGNWRLTRGQHISWLQESDEAKVLKLIGFGTEKCGNPCPKIFSHCSQHTPSWLEFEGTMLDEKLMCAQFNASMGDFRVLKILGEGAAGKVYQCVYRNDPVQYALKKMDISDDFDDIETMNGEEPREVNILSRLEDDFVVGFFQAWAADGEYKSYLSSDDEEDTTKDGLLEPRYVVIQMEFCQRTLKDDLPYKEREINVEESWRIFEEITRGLQCMHRMGIIHRDLKPDNIFIGINGRIKIGDMGHACWAENGELIRTPDRGTFLYNAPELDTGHGVTIKADIYSIGVIFMELFHPFLTVFGKKEALSEFRNNMQPTDWKGDTKFFMQLIALCPTNRPSTEEVLDYIAQRRKNIDSQ